MSTFVCKITFYPLPAITSIQLGQVVFSILLVSKRTNVPSNQRREETYVPTVKLCSHNHAIKYWY